MSVERNYKKTYENEQQQISIELKGEAAQETFSQERSNQLLERCFAQKESYLNLPEDVSWVRTIFHDYHERFLQVDVQSETQKVGVTYVNNDLIFYQCKEVLGKSKKDLKVVYQVQYSKNNQVQFTLSDSDGQIVEYPFYKNSLSLIQESMKEIRNLKRAYPVTLEEDGKALCEIYQLFYQELPDFSLEETKIKMQAMLSVLVECNISLGEKYAFSHLSPNGLPISNDLDVLLSNLKPLGQVERQEEPFLLAKEPQERIQIAGEIFHQNFASATNPLEMLETMSRVIYESRYDLLGARVPSILARNAHCSVEDVEQSIQYVKQIREKSAK